MKRLQTRIALALALGGLALGVVAAAAGETPQLSADLAVSATSSAGQGTVGQNLSFVFTVENKGPETATGVKLTDSLAGKLKLVSGTSNHGKCFVANRTYTCVLGKLLKGDTAQFTVVVVPGGAGVVTSTASAGGKESDPDTSNQQAQVNVNVVYVDPTPPVQAAVHVNSRLVAPVFTAATAFPVRWTATDAESGLGAFDVRYRQAAVGRDFGSYFDWQKAEAKLRVATFKARPGYTYCFSTRATNGAGVTSGWSREACTGIPLGALAFSPAKPWVKAQSRAYYLGTSIAAAAKSAKLTKRLVAARHIGLDATRCPTCGGIFVVWNGKLLRRVSLGGQAVKRRVLIPLASFHAPQTGTLKLEIASNGKSVRIEGLAITRV